MNGQRTTYNAPCLATFEEVANATSSKIVTITHRAIFSFYQGKGKVASVVIREPPKEIGIPLIKAILETQSGIMAHCPDVMPQEFSCPGPDPDKKPCGNKAVEVTIDRRLDGYALLRLRCPACGTVSVVDVIAKDLRLMCEECGRAKNDVRLGTVGETKKRLCAECFEKTRKEGA